MLSFIPDNDRFHHCSLLLEGTGAVILAIRSREDGNKDFHLIHLLRGEKRSFRLFGQVLTISLLQIHILRIKLFKGAGIGSSQSLLIEWLTIRKNVLFHRSDLTERQVGDTGFNNHGARLKVCKVFHRNVKT